MITEVVRCLQKLIYYGHGHYSDMILNNFLSYAIVEKRDVFLDQIIINVNKLFS